MPEVVNLEERMLHHLASGRGVAFEGGMAEQIEDGHGVRINVPTVAKGAALIVNRHRTPDQDPAIAQDRCTKCGGGDVVLVLGFPGGDGDAMKFCRSCLNRPVGRPLVIQFRA